MEGEDLFSQYLRYLLLTGDQFTNNGYLRRRGRNEKNSFYWTLV